MCTCLLRACVRSRDRQLSERHREKVDLALTRREELKEEMVEERDRLDKQRIEKELKTADNKLHEQFKSKFENSQKR